MPVRLPPLTEPAPRILLEGLVDYAGLFAPASLTMPAAVRNYAHYRASGSGWMLGRFICPVQSLGLFSETADPLLPRDAGAIPWRLSVTGSPDLASDLAEIAAFNARHVVCLDEYSAHADVYEVKAASVDDIERIAAHAPPALCTYLEVPLDGDVDAAVAAIARVGRRAKIRMGGTTADMMPSPASVVRFVRACIAHGVIAKATAGLHHPLCGDYRLTYEPEAASGRMYGFLNLVLAAAHLGNGGDDDVATQLLEERDATRFEFTDLHVAWRGPSGIITFTRDVLQQLRQAGLVSFGSCSFTEPVNESRAFGWI